jgi:pimeloyl-ACP methyl ester carboxylesterase
MVRAWFGTVSRLAPRVAERQAARLFLTPRRRRISREPALEQPARPFTVELDRHRLAAWSWGEGPLALLIHGWEGSAAHMAPAAMRLAGEGFRAVVLDMPAHGRSSGRLTSLVEWLQILGALPAAIGSPEAVIGHSFGATALTLALADGLPARRAVLLAPPLGPLHFIEHARRFIGLPEHRVPGMVRRLEEIVGRKLTEFDTSRAARAVTVPGLILHDPLDPDVPWSHATELADAWSGSQLVASAGVGHYRILSDAATLDALTRFVRRESPSADDVAG